MSQGDAQGATVQAIGVWMATAALLAVTANGVAAQGRPSLSGQWRLNAGASDAGGAPSDAGMPGPQGGRAPLGGGFGGLGGPPMGGMRGRAPVDPDQLKQRRDLVRELLEPVARFTLAHDAQAVTFTYADGRQVRYRTSGRPEKHQAVNGTVETETRWKGETLERETNLDDGLRITETFTRESATQLVVTVKVSGGPMRRARPLRRVYELEEPADAGEERDGA
jgi:hypothetical protein